MFSKRQFVFLIAIAIIGTAIGFNTAAHNKRIRQLTATEAKLAEYSEALENNLRNVGDLASRFKNTSNHREALRDSATKQQALETEIETLKADKEPDANVKWATTATVIVEEFIIPRETADKLLEKFDRRELDSKMRDQLLARPNHLRFTHRFETIVLPASNPDERNKEEFGFDQRREFTTSSSDTTVGELSPTQHALNLESSYASELEELVIHTALNRTEVTSQIGFTLRESAGFTVGTWSIFRIAEPFRNPNSVYRVQLDTQLAVSPDRFQYIGSSPFQINAGSQSRPVQNQGTLLVFTKVDFHDDGENKPAAE